MEDVADPPLVRMRRLVHAFIHSECEEAPVRVALNDAAPLYRDAPQSADRQQPWETASILIWKHLLTL
ncbi:hypothetical protein [Sphingomonas gellani]|uniref:hypothetical protein n=1 Tax=Sphingomonas gellani TaxID=1166340 RepID=UPI000B225434|nr:hypothetical protein [Sphingomonas gellani]